MFILPNKLSKNPDFLDEQDSYEQMKEIRLDVQPSELLNESEAQGFFRDLIQKVKIYLLLYE